VQQLAQLDDETLVGARPGSITRVRIIEGGVQIDCYGRRIPLPSFTRPAVEYALAQPSFRLRQLPGPLHAGATSDPRGASPAVAALTIYFGAVP